MSFMPTPSKNEYESPLPGTHIGIAYKVLDLGTQKNDYPGSDGKSRRQVFIDFELPESRKLDGHPMTIGKFYTYSSHEKATLRLHLESWRTKRFNDEEIVKFDLFSVIGKPCLLNIIEKESGGVKIGGIGSMPAALKAAKYQAEGVPVKLWLTTELFNQAAFDGLTDGMKEIIKKSPEYHELQAVNLSDAAEPSQPSAEINDDIPF